MQGGRRCMPVLSWLRGCRRGGWQLQRRQSLSGGVLQLHLCPASRQAIERRQVLLVCRFQGRQRSRQLRTPSRRGQRIVRWVQRLPPSWSWVPNATTTVVRLQNLPKNEDLLSKIGHFRWTFLLCTSGLCKLIKRADIETSFSNYVYVPTP